MNMKRNFIAILAAGILCLTVACEPKKSADQPSETTDTLHVKADTTAVTEPVQDSAVTQ
jgi:hypothetical protein